MDNITHTLIGAATGELLASYRKKKNSSVSDRERSLILTASIIGNNFPDLDFLYAKIIPGQLGYLLHHRGHTHTLGGIFLEAPLILLALYLLRKFFKWNELGRSSWVFAFITTFMGLCLHVAADSMNTYGVHPFYPFSNKWVYGDALYILEPILWITCVFTAISFWKSKLLSYFWVLLCAGLPVLGIKMGAINYLNLLFLYSLLGFLFLLWKLQRTTLLKTIAISLSFLFIGGQYAVSHHLKDRIKTNYESKIEGARVVDIITSAFPTQPLCWISFTLWTKGNDPVLNTDISISSFQNAEWIEKHCPNYFNFESFSTPQPKEIPDKKSLLLSRAQTNLNDLRKLKETNCRIEAWLRFARAPYIRDDSVIDLRFTRSRRGSFTKISTKENECPRFVPPWDFPRADIVN